MATQESQHAATTLPTLNTLCTTTSPAFTAPLTTSPTSSTPLPIILPGLNAPLPTSLPTSNTLFIPSDKRELIDPAILQSGSALSGLLAAVAAQLLTFFKDDANFKRPDSEKRDAILSLTYISLVSSIFATTSSLALTVASIDSHRRKRLSFFFIEIVFKLWVYSLVIVTACTVASIVAYIALNEQSKVAVAVYVVAGLVSLLLGWFSCETLFTVTIEIWRRRRDRRRAKRANTA